MPTKINSPAVIEATGTKPKIIEEYIGNVNSKTGEVSIAKMKSPAGWEEPGQKPEFDEYNLVLKGELHVKTESGNVIIVKEGEVVIAHKNEWVQYSTPNEPGAEYVSVCIPAFSPATVHRDE